MTIKIIVAVSDDNVIGKGGQLPWHLPKDLARFRSLTLGSNILMGRKTFESIGTPLVGRRCIVLSSTPIQGVETVQEFPLEFSGFVIGGAQVYKLALPLAHRLYITRVHTVIDEKDLVYMPKIDWKNWKFVRAEVVDTDSIPFTLEEYTWQRL